MDPDELDDEGQVWPAFALIGAALAVGFLAGAAVTVAAAVVSGVLGGR